MKFFRKNQNINEYVDNIFPVVAAAKADTLQDRINGTAGCLSDEDGKLFVYNTVFKNEKNIEDIKKAAYASSPAGNKDYINAISKYVLEDKVTNNHCTIATVGGTGALYLANRLCLDQGDEIIYPEIAWGNYKVIAQENNLISLTYDVYDLNDLFNKIDSCKDKAYVMINSPCENPLGHSYSNEQWDKIFDKLNNCGKEIVLLIDNAYMDYAYNNPKSFFHHFNELNDNVLVLIVVSCSKSFSYYGIRLGALIAINNDAEFIKRFENLASRVARSTWSNASNGAMLTVTDVLNNHFDEYVKERDESVKMIKARTDLFVKQASEVSLPIYPYTEGFFVTIKIEDKTKLDEVHVRLMDNHIYTIKVNKGIRVGICSIPLKHVDGLAKRIKELM